MSNEAELPLKDQLMHYEWKLRQAEHYLQFASNSITIRNGRNNIKLYKQRIAEINAELRKEAHNEG